MIPIVKTYLESYQASAQRFRTYPAAFRYFCYFLFFPIIFIQLLLSVAEWLADMGMLLIVQRRLSLGSQREQKEYWKQYESSLLRAMDRQRQVVEAFTEKQPSEETVAFAKEVNARYAELRRRLGEDYDRSA